MKGEALVFVPAEDVEALIRAVEACGVTVPDRRDTFPLDDLSRAAELHPTGLRYTRDLSFDEWSEHLSRLTKAGEAVQWWIGDSLRYGEREWGEMYAQAIEASEYTYGALANLVFVCSAVDFSRRRENLSFSHHSEVASLDPPEQERLLEAAEERGWSRNDLREAVRSYKRELERQENEDATGGEFTDETARLARLALARWRRLEGLPERTPPDPKGLSPFTGGVPQYAATGPDGPHRPI